MKKIYALLSLLLFIGIVSLAQEHTNEITTNISKNELDSIIAYNENKSILDVEESANLLTKATQKGDKLKMVQAMNMLALAHMKQGKYASAMDYINKSLDLAFTIKDPSIIAHCQFNAGLIAMEQEYYNSSIVFFKKAYANYRDNNNVYEQILTLNNLGKVYNLKKNDSALVVLNDAMELAKTKNVAERIPNILTELGNYYIVKKDYVTANNHLNKAYQLFQEKNNLSNMADIQTIMGNIFSIQNKILEAKDQYEKALSIYQKLNRSPKVIELCMKLAYIFGNKNFVSTEKYCLIALDVAEQNGYYEFTSEITTYISDLYEQRGDYSNALLYYKKYSESIIAYNQAQNDDQKKYFEQKTEVATEAVRQQERYAKLKSDQQNQKIFFVIVSIVIIGFGATFYFRYREKNKINRTLALNNAQINEQKEELQQTLFQLNENQIRLKEANATKDKMFSIIGHDLRNPIGSFKSMTEMLAADYQQFDNDTLVEIFKELSISANQTYNLLENLLFWAKSEKGEMNFKPEKINLNLIVEENVSLLLASAKNKNIHLQSLLDVKVEAFADKNMITTVIRNLVSNSLKFTPIGGRVSIAAKTIDNFVEVTIIDTGVGISEENMKKMFVKNEHFTTYGTNQEKGSGLGLTLCKEFIDRNNGKIWVESEFGKGSSFKFTLPTKAL